MFSQSLDRGVQAVARGAVSFASQVHDRGAQAGAQAGAQTVSCGHATLSQQENNTRQMSRRIE